MIAQEYIPHNEGEYTVGVLSLPNGKITGSIALKRTFNCKLSYLIKYDDRIISSGYSQGLFGNFNDIRKQAEDIALKIDSRGPLNIQGRVKEGVFYPLSMLPMFKNTDANTISYDIYKRAINLPSYYDMSTSDLQKIVDVISQYCNL